jgi:hypothetical protein
MQGMCKPYCGAHERTSTSFAGISLTADCEFLINSVDSELRAFFLDLSTPIFFRSSNEMTEFSFCFPIHILENSFYYSSRGALDDSQSRLVSVSLGACVTLLLQLLPSVKKRINSRWMPDSLRTLRFQLVACYKLKPDFFSLIMQVLRY